MKGGGEGGGGAGGGGGSVKCNRISQASIHSQKGRQEGQGHGG